MKADDVDTMVRRAIAGDDEVIAGVLATGGGGADPRTVLMAAVLAGRPDWASRAEALATTSRDRQMVAIGAVHLAGDVDLARTLARDHLSEHPDSLIVAWIASLGHDG